MMPLIDLSSTFMKEEGEQDMSTFEKLQKVIADQLGIEAEEIKKN